MEKYIEEKVKRIVEKREKNEKGKKR